MQSSDRDGYVGNEACAQCHSSIYESYKRTPMAHASGIAIENLIPADFTHRQSGVHYRIYEDAGRAWLSFDRDGKDPIHAKRELLYYIGSGRRGLTYLFADDGFVFESPINWYGDRHVWDMTPAYQGAREMPLNLPAHTSCLHCHVSGMRPPVDGTENRYEMPLLAHSGVSCERCHGPAAAHIKGGSIVNPAKLTPERRDAICMQCHMEGRVSIERAGRHIYDFRPGDSLSDYVRYYVLTGGFSSELGAVSQVEALAQSTCKKASGDKMSCTSCHDPHFTPSAAERVEYFRGKCLACHGASFAAKHHAEQKDCTTCHMPASPSKDVAHTEVTDHRIPRMPALSPQLLQDTNASASKPELVPFPDTKEAEDDLRDLALAWESLANSGMRSARPEAEKMLRRSSEKFPDDPATVAALAYEDQLHGDLAGARTLYQRALAANPALIDAATNLGVIEAQSGNFPVALQLLEGAFSRAPWQSSVGIDLARVFCFAGRAEQGRTVLDRVLEFNPDMAMAKRVRDDLARPKPACGGK
ncbi:MAG TPA: tetratricopeptide repeat protein [Terriglobales bacterium]|nr:tetratricopeptide repeat protein [Terriglobales bacterium]